MAKPALTVVISGDATQLNRAFHKAEKDVDRLDKRTGTFSKRFASSMKVAGAAAGGALAIGLKQSVSAAVEAEKSQARLQAQLKASGISYDKHSAAIEKSINATSRLSGLDDEGLQDSFTNIVRVTGDVNEALRLNALAADFARAKNMDIAKAGELVGKVAGGNIGVLSRYGIQIDKGASSTEALGVLQEKFAGQAEAYGKTTAGASDRAKVGFENLQEVVGERLAPALAKVANKFADLAEWAQRNPKEFKAITIAVGGLVAGLAALSIIGKVAAGFKALQGAAIALNIALRANPIGLVITALTALGVGLVIAYKKSETFRNIVDGAFKAIKTAAREAIQFIIGAIDKWMGAYSSMLSALSRVPGFGWAKRAADAIDGVREKLRKFSRSLDEIPRVKDIKVNVKLKLPKTLTDILSGRAKGTATLTPKFPDGDGLGVPAPKGSTSLQGANRALSPLASIGSRMGLRVSSGMRPGAITSSGNESYHGSGEAIDMAGPPKAMLRYFNAMKNFYGPRLAELIYTPGGQGIKDGRPFSYGGKVAADHYDHVHVALDLGKRGPGIGDGIGDAVRGARAAGFSGNELVTMVAIAGPESGYRDSARLVTSAEDSRGMWQVNTKAHPWARSLNLKDTTTAARAARRVWLDAGRSWEPWTSFTSGSYRGFLDRAREAVVGSRGGSSRPSSTRGGRGSTPRPQTTAGRNPDGRGTITTGSPSYEQDLAEADVGVAEAERAKDVARQVAAQTARRAVVRARLNKVTAALRKRNLRPATRLRLTQERAQLLGELGAADSAIADLTKAPESTDDPNQALIDATQAWIDAVEAQREEARRIAEEAAERERERIASMNALRASLDAMTAFANQVSAVTSMQAVRAMGDVISGQLGARVQQRGTMPGSGALASLGRS